VPTAEVSLPALKTSSAGASRSGRADDAPARPLAGCVCALSALPDSRSATLRLADAVLLLRAVPSPLVVSAVAALMEERRVAIVAASPTFLARSVLAIVSMLHPFEWPHVLVPALTREMLPVLCAPCPFLVGVTPAMVEEAASTWLPMDDVVFIHLDPPYNPGVRPTDPETGDPARRLPRRSRTKLFRRLAKLVSRISSLQLPPGHTIVDHVIPSRVIPSDAENRAEDSSKAGEEEISQRTIQAVGSAIAFPQTAASFNPVASSRSALSDTVQVDPARRGNDRLVDAAVADAPLVSVSRSEPELRRFAAKPPRRAVDDLAFESRSTDGACAVTIKPSEDYVQVTTSAMASTSGTKKELSTVSYLGRPVAASMTAAVHPAASPIEDSSGDSSGHRRLPPFSSGPVRRVRSVPISGAYEGRVSLVSQASAMYQADDVPISVVLHRIMSKFFASIMASKHCPVDDIGALDPEFPLASAHKVSQVSGVSSNGIVPQVFSRRELEHRAFLSVFKNTQMYMQWVDAAAPSLPDISFGVQLGEPVSSRLLLKGSTLRDAAGRMRAIRRSGVQPPATADQTAPKAILRPSVAHIAQSRGKFAVASDSDEVDHEAGGREHWGREEPSALTDFCEGDEKAEGNPGRGHDDTVGSGASASDEGLTRFVVSIEMESTESRVNENKTRVGVNDRSSVEHCHSGFDHDSKDGEKVPYACFENAPEPSGNAQSRTARWLANAMGPREGSKTAPCEQELLEDHGKNNLSSVWPSFASATLRKRVIGNVAGVVRFPPRARVAFPKEKGTEERSTRDGGQDPSNYDVPTLSDGAVSRPELSGLTSGTDCEVANESPEPFEPPQRGPIPCRAEMDYSESSFHDPEFERDMAEASLEYGQVGWTWANPFQKRGKSRRSRHRISRQARNAAVARAMMGNEVADEGIISRPMDASKGDEDVLNVPSETSDVDEFESEIEIGEESDSQGVGSFVPQVIPCAEFDDFEMLQDRDLTLSNRKLQRRSMRLIARRSQREVGEKYADKKNVQSAGSTA
jgi:hypothetical protein